MKKTILGTEMGACDPSSETDEDDKDTKTHGTINSANTQNKQHRQVAVFIQPAGLLLGDGCRDNGNELSMS